MSHQIALVDTPQGDITLTQFWGGEHRGKCLQVTQPWDGHSRYLQLTTTELILLLPHLKAWLDKQVAPKDPGDWDTKP